MKKFFFVLAASLITFLFTTVAEAKNIFKIGSDFTVTAEQQVDSVFVVGGQVTVDGLVENSVIAIGGSVILTNRAVVRGNVVAVGGIVAEGNGSQVFGDISEINFSNLVAAIESIFRGEMEGWSLLFNIISLCFFAIILTFALLVAWLVPHVLTAVTGTILENKGKSFLWGLLASLMIVPLFMLLAISIIGITLIPLAFTLILLAFLLGYIAVASLFGNFILVRIFRRQKKSLVGQTFLGLMLIWLIGWIPYLGWIVKVAVLTIGMGGVLLAIFYRKKNQPPSYIASSPAAGTPFY